MPPNTLCMDATCAFRDIDEHTTTESAEADIFNQRIIEPCDEPTVNVDNADNGNERRASESSESEVFDERIFELCDEPTVNVANAENHTETMLTIAERFDAEIKTNWQARNETTPAQKIVTGSKRRQSNDSVTTTSTAALRKVRRNLFANDVSNKYESIFKANYRRKTCAEADVATLLHLIQVYGARFYEYAKNHAILYEEILEELPFRRT